MNRLRLFRDSLFTGATYGSLVFVWRVLAFLSAFRYFFLAAGSLHFSGFAYRCHDLLAQATFPVFCPPPFSTQHPCVTAFMLVCVNASEPFSPLFAPICAASSLSLASRASTLFPVPSVSGTLVIRFGTGAPAPRWVAGPRVCLCLLFAMGWLFLRAPRPVLFRVSPVPLGAFLSGVLLPGFSARLLHRLISLFRRHARHTWSDCGRCCVVSSRFRSARAPAFFCCCCPAATLLEASAFLLHSFFSA